MNCARAGLPGPLLALSFLLLLPGCGREEVSVESAPAGQTASAGAEGAGGEGEGEAKASATPTDAGLVRFDDGGLWGFRDPTGEVRLPASYRAAGEFEGRAVAWIVDSTGPAWIGSDGVVRARAFVFDNGADSFHEGLTRVVQDGLVGFMDEAGEVVIPARFPFALPFEGGAALVCEGCSEEASGEHRRIVGGSWGAIGRRGAVLVPIQHPDRSAAARALALRSE